MELVLKHGKPKVITISLMLSKKINMLVWILSVLIALNLIAIVGIALTMLMNFNLTNFGVIN